MATGKRLKWFTLEHLDRKAEIKNCKELFSNSKEKNEDGNKKLTKTCTLKAYAVAY